jgi:hypothetical protein
MISEIREHVRYKANWLLVFSVKDYNLLTKQDNRHAFQQWLGSPDLTDGEREGWKMKDKYLGNIMLITGPGGTTYNLKWNHWSGDYMRNFKNKSWYHFFYQIIKNDKKNS